MSPISQTGRSILPAIPGQSFFKALIRRGRNPPITVDEGGPVVTNEDVVQDVKDVAQNMDQDVKQDANDLEKLHAWPAVICDAVGLYGRWNNIWGRQDPVKNTGVKVNALFQVDFLNLFTGGLEVVELGRAMGAGAIELCKSIEQGHLRGNLEQSVRVIVEIVDKAVGHMNDMSAHLCKIRQRILEVERALRSSGYVMKRLAVELLALKRSVLENLAKQEEIITVLIDWWKSVELQLNDVRGSVEVDQGGSHFFQSHKYWEEVEMNYRRYGSKMHQLQDQYPILRREPVSINQ